MNIKCPHCGKVLLIKQQISDFSKVVKCPVCHEASPLRDFKIIEEIDKGDKTNYGIKKDETKYSNKPEGETTIDNGETTIGDNSIPQSGFIIDLGSPNDPPYRLKKGKNIIGRAWSGNTITDIGIHTPGKNRMSREHLVIEVKDVDGRGTVYQASLYKRNVNPTFINKEQLTFNDCVILHEGDIIDLPDASLKFTLKN